MFLINLRSQWQFSGFQYVSQFICIISVQEFREGSESSEITDDSDKIDLGDNLHNNLKSGDW